MACPPLAAMSAVSTVSEVTDCKVLFTLVAALPSGLASE